MVAPEATRIGDFYHVAERIDAIGELRYGAQTPASERWIKGSLEKLKASELSAVIGSIAHLQLPTAAAEQTRAQVLGYLQHQRPALDYAQYRAQNMPIGRGAGEGGCRLVGARTNGCGRRWSVAGGDAIVALRVAVLNDRLDLIRPRPRLTWQEAA
ncbi:MAG: hypothetical protein HY314_15900 [Acidobacteria bacterium]|nr:hypothetical protein [Acidobacteriota bacterium]